MMESSLRCMICRQTVAFGAKRTTTNIGLGRFSRELPLADLRELPRRGAESPQRDRGERAVTSPLARVSATAAESA